MIKKGDHVRIIKGQFCGGTGHVVAVIPYPPEYVSKVGNTGVVQVVLDHLPQLPRVGLGFGSSDVEVIDS